MTHRRFVCAALALFCSCSGLVIDPPGDGGAGGAGGGGGVGDAGVVGGGTGGDADAGMGGGSGGGGGEGIDAGAGGGGGGDVDAGATRVPVFVAIGYVARTTVSCDDGLTWVGDRSDDDAVRCFNGMPLADGGSSDCDHHLGAGRGVGFTGTAFVANFGWGDPGTIRRSVDGVAWSTVDTGANFASMVVGNDGRLLAAARGSKVSTDDGLTWTNAAEADLKDPGGATVWNVRRGGFGGSDGGVFVIVGDGPSVAMSADGTAWRFPSTLPSACGQAMQWEGGVAGNADVIVMLGGDGVACRSTDDGDTWTQVSTGATDISSRLLWTGSEFLAWGTGGGAPQRFRSVDGATWTSAPTTVTRTDANGLPATSPGPSVGPVARSPAGTFVAVRGGWDVWYDKQRFYRSLDGLSWTELPAGAFTGSHPLTHIAWGEASRGALCP